MLVVQSREKWNSLERTKLYFNPLYNVQPCPVTLDALTWISAYLRYYFINHDSDDYVVTNIGTDDLERVANILVHHPTGPSEIDIETEIFESLI